MVGVPELVYLGNQGFELLAPGEDEPRLDPAAEPGGDRARKFLEGLEFGKLERLGSAPGGQGPDPGSALARRRRRGAGARTLSEAIAALATHANLIPLWGRKVLDLRPVAGIDKGSAVHRLLVEHAPLDAAIFAGDDRTDLDAFRALARLAGRPRLGAAVRAGRLHRGEPRRDRGGGGHGRRGHRRACSRSSKALAADALLRAASHSPSSSSRALPPRSARSPWSSPTRSSRRYWRSGGRGRLVAPRDRPGPALRNVRARRPRRSRRCCARRRPRRSCRPSPRGASRSLRLWPIGAFALVCLGRGRLLARR